MLTLNDLLEKSEIDPNEVLIMRHRPTERSLQRMLPWWAVQRPELFNAYQSAQGTKNVETALSRAKYLASFIGVEPGKAHFVGLYRQNGFQQISSDQYFAIPENAELHQHGISAVTRRSSSLWFDLVQDASYCDLQGRLIITWTGLERSWYRWAYRNEFPIFAILEENQFAEDMPNWRSLVLSWDELDSMPDSWRAALAEWRGIYLIIDHKDGKSYVGSAYGFENILGRWNGYKKSGHGGNVQLKRRDPKNFVFSILQRVSPDMEPEDVIALENSWKARLQSREIGLNSN